MNFSDFGLKTEILHGVEEAGFEQPTPIQADAIPRILSGYDLVAQAQTGTGKTAAFGLPLLNQLAAGVGIQVVIMTPTRELAIQVSEELARLVQFTHIRVLPIYGGQDMRRQIRALKHRPQVIVATPGRLLDHLRRRTVRFDDLTTVVLDEADEMLAMGFIDDIELILKQMPPERQTLLFSATIPGPIRRIVKDYLRKPQWVKIASNQMTVPQIDQTLMEVRPDQKPDALTRVLDADAPDRCLVFCRTKRGVDELTARLQQRGYFAGGLHGDMNQRVRETVMNGFRSGNIEVLVATDVAARGLDVEGISHVINYDIPQDAETYVHRIGRTGRAGRTGAAITFLTRRERKMLDSIRRTTNANIHRRALPTVADVRERRLESVRERLESRLEEGTSADFHKFAEELIDSTDDATDLLAAALALLVQNDVQQFGNPRTIANTGAAPPAGSRGAKSTSTGGEPGMARLFINAGRRDQVGPGDIVGMIAGEAKVPGQAVGRIDIHDDFSFVDVPEDLSSNILAAMRNTHFRGQRLEFRSARGDEGRMNRRRKTRQHHS